MWIRSATSNTWGMLWLIRMTGRPLALICWIRFEHLAGLLDAERRRRLVEHDELGAERRGAGHGDGLALAAGQGLHGLAHVLQGADAEVGHRLAGVVLHALLVEHPEHRAERARAGAVPGRGTGCGDVQRRGDGQGLVDGLDAGAAGVLRGLEVHRLAVQEDLAGVGDQAPVRP